MASNKTTGTFPAPAEVEGSTELGLATVNSYWRMKEEENMMGK